MKFDNILGIYRFLFHLSIGSLNLLIIVFFDILIDISVDVQMVGADRLPRLKE